MSVINLLCFSATVVMSVMRNTFSKAISNYKFGTKEFFKLQSLIFFCGFAVLLVPTAASCSGFSLLTFIYSAIYALLLIAAQWNYVIALSSVNVSVCVTVYSCGFIFPALSGALFWNESFTIFKLLSIVLTVFTIFISHHEKKALNSPQPEFFRLICAMTASGGLGIMQKIQQMSHIAEEKLMFVISAFFFAGIISLVCEKITTCSESHTMRKNEIIHACTVGICFACCNLLNTHLAGVFDSAFFFPTQNIAVIIVSIIVCTSIFKEHFGKKEAAALFFGVCAVILNR